MERRIRGIFEALIIIGLFLFFSYLVQSNIEFLKGLVTNNFIGILIYLFIEVSSIVIAPVTTLPLVVVASNLWGWFWTGVLNVAGWTIGSLIAFVIARRYGVIIIKKFISLKDIHKIEKRVPKEHLFWSVVLLRIIIPVDILSYALGLFTRMSTKSYTLATLIGIMPFAFAWAYLGKFPFIYQIILVLILGILISLGWIIRLVCKRCSEIFRRN